MRRVDLAEQTQQDYFAAVAIGPKKSGGIESTLPTPEKFVMLSVPWWKNKTMKNKAFMLLESVNKSDVEQRLELSRLC